MFFKKQAQKMYTKNTVRLNHCLLLRRCLRALIEEKNCYIYGNPIWVNANLLVYVWNERIDAICREVPEFKKKLQKIKGYNAFDLLDESKIPVDQIGRDGDGNLYSYVNGNQKITVRELRENQDQADWSFYAKGYEAWRDCSDWQCTYANRNWPWITYLVSQYQCTIPKMEESIEELIKEMDKEIGSLKKKLASN